MNNEVKGVVLINVSNSGLSLFDVNRRAYTVDMGGRLRISDATFLDILDHMASRNLILKGFVKIEGAKRELLENGGLTYDEINFLLGNVVEKEVVKEVIVKEPVIEEVVVRPLINEVEEVEAVIEKITEEAKIETTLVDEVASVTYYNWLKNNKFEKISESLSNEKNVETLKEIVKKEKAKKTSKYNIQKIEKILGVK